jgi:hypothetical protein
MQKPQVYLSQSLHRAQNFLVAHSETVGPANSSEGRRQLDQAIVAMDSAVIEQDTVARELRGEVSRRGQLERVLMRKYMTPLAKFARASLTGVPDFVAITPSAQHLKRDRLVTAARSMAAAADKYAAQLGQAKFPPTFLAQFRSATDAVQSSLELSQSKRVARTGATKRIALAGAQGRRAIAAIDATLSHLILGDERLEREWRAAKRMQVVAALPYDAGTIAGSISPSLASTPEVTKAAA